MRLERALEIFVLGEGLDEKLRTYVCLTIGSLTQVLSLPTGPSLRTSLHSDGSATEYIFHAGAA